MFDGVGALPVHPATIHCLDDAVRIPVHRIRCVIDDRRMILIELPEEIRWHRQQRGIGELGLAALVDRGPRRDERHDLVLERRGGVDGAELALAHLAHHSTFVPNGDEPAERRDAREVAARSNTCDPARVIGCAFVRRALVIEDQLLGHWNLSDDTALTPARIVDAMAYYLDLADGGPLIPCRDAHQARLLARVYVAITTGRPTAASGSSGHFG